MKHHANPTTKSKRIGRRLGISLVEVLVVIGIIAVLLAIAFPAIQMIRDGSRRTQCLSNVRQLVLANQNFESAHQVFPIGIHIPKGVATNKPTEFFSWSVDLSEFMESASQVEGWLSASDNKSLDDVIDSLGGSAAEDLKRPVPWLRCPADTDLPMINDVRAGENLIGNLAAANYVASNNVGLCHGLRNSITREAPNGSFQGIEAESSAGLEDGTSHTVLFSERIYGSIRKGDPQAGAALQFGSRGAGSAANPSEPGIHDVTFGAAGGVNRFRIPASPDLVKHGVSSGHAGGVVIGLADGSVHFMNSKIDSYYLENETFERPPEKDQYGVWERLIAVNDGQAVPDFNR